MNARSTILLNPGPVTLTDGVRAALTREDQCHREPDFAQMMLDIIDRLGKVYQQSHFKPVVLSGSGTCAVEAMLSSLAPKEGKTLVVCNGVYGERMAAMLRAHGKPMAQIQSDWLQAMDLDAVEQQLKDDKAVTHVVAVHNETTTGRLNDIAALGALCKQYNKALLLDAVSSFGAEAIDFDNWNLQAVAATANKCLHGVPGIAFVMMESQIFELFKTQSDTLYLDLFRYEKEQRSGFSPFTQAVHACFALQQALLELEQQGGWPARHARYQQIAGRVRDELKAMGIACLLDESVYSSMISSFHLPQGQSYEQLHDTLRAAGFVIYAGQGELSKTIFRIANMGDILDADIDRLLACFKNLLAH